MTLDDQGETIRAKLRRRKELKLSDGRMQVAKAFAPEEKAALLAEAKNRRCRPSIRR